MYIMAYERHIHHGISQPASLECWWIERVHCILCDATLQVEMQTATAITICQDMLACGCGFLGRMRWWSCLVVPYVLCELCVHFCCLLCLQSLHVRAEDQSHIRRKGTGLQQGATGYRTLRNQKGHNTIFSPGQKIR